MCGRQAPVLCWYSLGCSLLGQGSTNLDTGCQEKTSWIIHWTLITASVTCTGECRMGTPELGSTVVYFNELLPLLRKLLSLLCSTERPRGVGGTKLWISAFEHWQTRTEHITHLGRCEGQWLRIACCLSALSCLQSPIKWSWERNSLVWGRTAQKEDLTRP